MHIIWDVQNAIPPLGHKTHTGFGESMHMGMKLQRDIKYEIFV
jgi:hypothetical protein